MGNLFVSGRKPLCEKDARSRRRNCRQFSWVDTGTVPELRTAVQAIGQARLQLCKSLDRPPSTGLFDPPSHRSGRASGEVPGMVARCGPLDASMKGGTPVIPSSSGRRGGLTGPLQVSPPIIPTRDNGGISGQIPAKWPMTPTVFALSPLSGPVLHRVRQGRTNRRGWPVERGSRIRRKRPSATLPRRRSWPTMVGTAPHLTCRSTSAAPCRWKGDHP